MKLFTSESVSRGHPDKICDQISDLIVDYCLESNPDARVAIEVMANKNKIIIAGEVKGVVVNTSFYIKIKEKCRDLLDDIGCNGLFFNKEQVMFEFYIHEQSDDISLGVDGRADKKLGAGDQGIVFGYANNETDVCMPSAIYYAHLILKEIDKAIKKDKLIEFGPDAKSQVTLNYRDDKPVSFNTIIVSLQHNQDVEQKQVADFVKKAVEKVVASSNIPEKRPVLTSKFGVTDCTKLLVNQTGRFIIGGPEADVGLTGRKIVVDSYGGYGSCGGGAFSGKDPSKVDRSASYMARYLAKNVVKAQIGTGCLIQLSYCIGRLDPISVYVKLTDNKKTNEELAVLENNLTMFINQNIDLTPQGIIDYLRLARPIYLPTSYYGHFGRKFNAVQPYFPWERLYLYKNLSSIY